MLKTQICVTRPQCVNVEVFSHASQFNNANSEFIKPVLKEKSKPRENKKVDWAWGLYDNTYIVDLLRHFHLQLAPSLRLQYLQ